MPVLANRAHGSDVQTAVSFLDEALSGLAPRAFSVRLWDGTTIAPTPGQFARFTLVLRHPGALRRMFWKPNELALGEAYIHDDFDVEGDLEMAVSVGQQLLERLCARSDRLRARLLLMRLPSSGERHPRRMPMLQGRLHSRDRDRQAIRYHYDVSNEFYSLFLDRRMVYSAGEFASPDEDLETAQERKLESLCRRLQLQPGDRFLDIGCGWGGLILHAVQNFGVRALGVTLSQWQAQWARKRIREAGLEERCRVEICDYRDLQQFASFDKISSIGMVEHVGARQLPGYFATIRSLLRRGGAFLNSGITRPPGETESPFVTTYVFPDGELEPIHQMLAAAENSGFDVRSTENTREDYGLTLRHWVRRLEKNMEEACRLTNQMTYRIWRLYMAGSAALFFGGHLQVFETLLTDRGSSMQYLQG